jgi:uncharacterized protein YbaR (Trm112 family)/SAM-dependent methyltransferase
MTDGRKPAILWAYGLMMSASLLPLLTCPACNGQGSLEARSDEIVCRECQTHYPTVDGIPLIFDKPDRELDEWRFELAEFLADNQKGRNKMLAQTAGVDLPATTRARLDRLRAVLEVHADRMTRLLGDAGIQPGERTREDRERVPGEGSITTYFHQIHRDWGWDDHGSQENREALQAIQAVVPADAKLGKVLVLGAGACRLPMDVHTTFGAELSVAVDINPLPFVVARRMAAAQEVSLFEFPISPRTSEDVAVDRLLRRGNPAPDPLQGFEFLFADGLSPPVRDGAFDTVFTPWFIDQVPRNLPTIFPMIRRVLKPGGRWINSGPLIYHPSHTMLSNRYRVDEVLEMLAAANIEVHKHRYASVPYMMSPAGTQGRTEFVLTFDATVGEAPASESEDTPRWLDRHDLPVPILPGLERYEPPHPMFAAVVSLVNGQRTIKDIANVLIRDKSLPADAAVGGVHACLVEIHRTLKHR